MIEIWKFVAPGLYNNEKKAFLPYLVATPILFIFGALLVYYFIMPIAIKFFMGFEVEASNKTMAMQLEAKVNEYLSLIMRLIFAFGLSFQLPVVLSLLARIGFVNSNYLRERRKYFIVIIFTAAAILTPPDPITQIGLAIPLLLLYELSIYTVSFIEKKMIDIKEIRNNLELIKENLKKRNSQVNLDELILIDKNLRKLISDKEIRKRKKINIKI